MIRISKLFLYLLIFLSVLPIGLSVTFPPTNKENTSIITLNPINDVDNIKISVKNNIVTICNLENCITMEFKTSNTAINNIPLTYNFTKEYDYYKFSFKGSTTAKAIYPIIKTNDVTSIRFENGIYTAKGIVIDFSDVTTKDSITIRNGIIDIDPIITLENIGYKRIDKRDLCIPGVGCTTSYVCNALKNWYFGYNIINPPNLDIITSRIPFDFNLTDLKNSYQINNIKLQTKLSTPFNILEHVDIRELNQKTSFYSCNANYFNAIGNGILYYTDTTFASLSYYNFSLNSNAINKVQYNIQHNNTQFSLSYKRKYETTPSDVAVINTLKLYINYTVCNMYCQYYTKCNDENLTINCIYVNATNCNISKFNQTVLLWNYPQKTYCLGLYDNPDNFIYMPLGFFSLNILAFAYHYKKYYLYFFSGLLILFLGFALINYTQFGFIFIGLSIAIFFIFGVNIKKNGE